MINKKYTFLLVAGLCFYAIQSYAISVQDLDQNGQFSEELLDSLRSISAYDYVDYQAEEKGWLQETWDSFWSRIGRGLGMGVSAVQKLFFYLLAIGAVIAIVYSIAKSKGVSFFKKADRQLSIQIEDLKNLEDVASFDSALAASKQKGDYRRAIQILYLKSLWLLHNREHIQVEKFKTNYQYIDEIKNRDLRDEFVPLVRFFEWCWYGEHEIDQPVFAEEESKFNIFFEKIESRRI